MIGTTFFSFTRYLCWHDETIVFYKQRSLHTMFMEAVL